MDTRARHFWHLDSAKGSIKTSKRRKFSWERLVVKDSAPEFI